MNDLPKTDPLTGKPLIQATPAATIIVAADQPDGSPRLLMVERSGKMAFAAGAVVFPGGRVDSGDYVLARRFLERDPDGDIDEPLADMAGRIAAIRETIEEARYPVAMKTMPGDDAIEAIRAEASGDSHFDAVVDRYALELEPQSLTYFARWRPPFNEKRVFDTRFYIARATLPEGQAVVDDTENRTLFWATAQEVLDRAEREEIKIIFPTRRNLEKLAQCQSYDALVAHVGAHPPELVTPFVEEREGEPHLCVPDGLGYPVTSEPIKAAMRG
ncbi:MAG: NUDIX hydrolase [Pseudomonadota bacterium]